jgi:hypothetical protein
MPPFDVICITMRTGNTRATPATGQRFGPEETDEIGLHHPDRVCTTSTATVAPARWSIVGMIGPARTPGSAFRVGGDATGLPRRSGSGMCQAGRASGGQAAEKIEQRGVDLGRALLLGPMAATSNHLYFAQCRHEMFEVCQKLVHPGEGDHEVAIA